MKRWSKAALVAFVAVLPLTMAPTGGGFPSRPKFQSVGVGVAAGSSGTIVTSGSITTGNDLLPAVDASSDVGTGSLRFRAINASGTVTASNYVGNVGGVSPSDFPRLSQANTFTGASQEIEGAAAVLHFDETDAAANERNWLVRLSGGIFVVSTAADASPTVAVNNAITIDRTGATVDSINLQAASVQVNGVAVATVQTGAFTATLTGCTTTTQGTAGYTIIGNVVTLSLPSMLCTSNSTLATITGLPAAIQPTAITGGFTTCGKVRDNGTDLNGAFELFGAGDSSISLFRDCANTSLTFTASGQKGNTSGGRQIFTYPLN